MAFNFRTCLALALPCLVLPVHVPRRDLATELVQVGSKTTVSIFESFLHTWDHSERPSAGLSLAPLLRPLLNGVFSNLLC